MALYLVNAATLLKDQNDWSFETAPVNGEVTSLTDGWTLLREDGTSQTISLPYTLEVQKNETLTITHPISFVSGETEAILLDCHRAVMVVSTDTGEIYRANTTEMSSRVRYTSYRIAALPKDETVTEVTVIFSGMQAGSFEIAPVYSSSLADAKSQILRGERLTIVLLVFFAIAVIVLLCVMFLTMSWSMFDTRFSILLEFFLLAFCWGAADSDVLAVLNVPQEFVGLLCYFSLMALPLPLIHFYWLSVDPDNRSFPFLAVVGAVNIVIQTVVSACGGLALNRTIFFSHALVIAYAMIAFVTLYRIRNSMEDRKEFALLTVGCVVLSVAGITGILLYWFRGGGSYRNCSLTGFLMFGVILFVLVVYHGLQERHLNAVRLSEMKLQEQLALTDAATGMKNRRAYEQYMKELEGNPSEEDRILYMMDMNGLKAVNDEFGHTAGDEMIIGTARMIESVYGAYGPCFRIGGDEFAAVLRQPDVPCKELDQRFLQEQERLSSGSAWQYSIACGHSHRLDHTGKVLTITEWKQRADIQMYRNKTASGHGRAYSRAEDLTEIINCVISTVEAKDPYTACHSERVRDLSIAIGGMLGVSQATLDQISSAAYMHDIGKIGIPDSILMKPGSLTSEEYAIIKDHAAIGARIIGNAKGLQDVAQIVRHHHERWDGRGYPDGLKGTDIPLESRIIAVADSIDAMTSKRCYRDSLTIEWCHDEIQRASGTMYDPAIAEIVIDNWDCIAQIVRSAQREQAEQTEQQEQTVPIIQKVQRAQQVQPPRNLDAVS